MDWTLLPLEPLETIFHQLEFKDRIACSLVCRRWNEVLFSCPALARSIIFSIGPTYSTDLRSVIRWSNRNYRQITIVLNHDSDTALSELIAETAERWDVKLVSLVGDPPKVLNCMNLNANLFNSITELNLEFTMDRAWPVISAQTITFRNLKKFNYLQVYTGSNPMGMLFRLVVPNLEEVSVVLDSLANEEAMYWADPLIEIVECNNLKSLEVDLNCTMWERFFATERPTLERLVIRRASDEFQERDWNLLFRNMPNLRYVEFVFSNDIMLSNLTRNCKKVERLMLNGFCLHDGSFANNMSLLSLKQVHMDGWMNGALFSLNSPLDLVHLEELTWKYVELAPAQGSFTLVTPELRRLTLRGCDYKRFLLEVGCRLEIIDMDYYEEQVLTPNFFDSLENLQHLTLHINSSSLKLVRHMRHLPQLNQLELVCSTERHGYDCNALFSSICSHCPELRELCIRNEHENYLSIGYRYFVQLVRLSKLRILTLQYITLYNVVGEIPMEHLVRLNVWGCIVIGKGPFKRFPIATHDSSVQAADCSFTCQDRGRW
ncbi:uncharacterized protein LOC131694249 [Topomyia yanbarensis]|uniref:uncharacterized protein LOC131694249 n=1 Tax=Topomyia yanbarensis TaxID=2498891 RepID=UPI00273B2B54|nr:uncharacterized protein LOC131694249 [Topomyia yanbarensis]